MNIEFIKSRIKNKEDIPLIEKSYNFANKKLFGINYTDGNPLIEHVLEIINTLLDFNADTLTIISAMLWQTLNYCSSIEEITNEFDNTVATITYKVATINNLEHSNSNDYELYLKEKLVDSPEDVRSLFIKLAERFNNLSTMQNLPIELQKNVAQDTLDILVPIASKLHLNFIRSRLEDLCLSYLEPEIYNKILNKLNGTPSELNLFLNNMKKRISDLLIENGINCTIKGRVKNIYNIYNKLCTGKNWDDIYDILALRILTEEEADCYKIAELIHSKYSYFSKRFKDYINNPKENIYQSLHTTIIDKDNRFYEIQIRTYDMNKTAESLHYLYKESMKKKL